MLFYTFYFVYAPKLDDNINGGGNTLLSNGNGISAERPLIGMYVLHKVYFRFMFSLNFSFHFKINPTWFLDVSATVSVEKRVSKRGYYFGKAIFNLYFSVFFCSLIAFNFFFVNQATTTTTATTPWPK